LSLPSTPQGLMPPPPQQNLAHLFSQALNNLSPQIPDYSGLINPFQQQLNRSWSGSSINENDFNHQSRRTNYNNNTNNNFEHNRGSSFNNSRRNDYRNNNNSRGGGNHFNDFNNTRDYSKQNNNINNKQQDIRRDRSRSRSPIRKRNRR
jgi:hypothetical protein